MPALWAGASLKERHRLLTTILDAVYFDAKDSRSVVAIKPKAAFRPIFQTACEIGHSRVVLVNEEPPKDLEAQADPCLRWRRGRERCLLLEKHSDRENIP